MPPVERHARREYELLSAIGDGDALTQRALAERLGVAVGLTNLYLKRLVTKGYVKVSRLNRKNLRYLLTPKGVAQRTRLTWEQMSAWAALYRRARRTLHDGLRPCVARGMRRFALYGVGEPAELAYLTLREFGLEPVGVFGPLADGAFLGYSVRALAELTPDAIDGVIVAMFERPNGQIAKLEALGIPREKIIPLRSPAGARKSKGDRHEPG